MNPAPAAAIGSVVSESFPENPCGLQFELRGELAHERLFAFDQVRPGLGVLSRGEMTSDRADPAADAIARFDDGDDRAGGFEVASRRQPRQPAAGDDHTHA